MKAEFDTAVLRAALQAVIPASSTDADRPHMNAVCIDTTDSKPRLVATDGHWLAEYAPEAKSVDEPGRVVIELYRAKKLVHLLADEIGTVLVVADDTMVRFEIEGVGRVDCRNMGTFPLTDSIWPVGDGKSVSRVGLSPKLLARVGKAFGATKEGLNFVFFGPNQPILITAESTPELRALLMPLRQLEMELASNG